MGVSLYFHVVNRTIAREVGNGSDNCTVASGIHFIVELAHFEEWQK